MGLFDDVKDSIPGTYSDSGSNSGSNDFDDSKFDSSFESDNSEFGGGNSDLQPETGPGTQGPQGNSTNAGNRPGQDPIGQPQNSQNNGPNNSNRGGRNQRNPPQDGRGNGSRTLGRGNSTPNGQAGRPSPGSSEPQLSSNTQREMENAGFDVDSGLQGGRGGQRRGNSTQSIADQQDDIEQLKSQNEQIIELLKRISDSLNSGGNSGGNTERRSGRR